MTVTPMRQNNEEPGASGGAGRVCFWKMTRMLERGKERRKDTGRVVQNIKKWVRMRVKDCARWGDGREQGPRGSH